MKVLIAVATLLASGLAGCAHQSQSPQESPAREWQAERADTGVAVSLAQFAENPRAVVGKQVSGQAEVLRVLSDRGFWLKVGDERVLAVVRDEGPNPASMDVSYGKTVQFSGLVFANTMAPQLSGNVDAAIEHAIRSEPAFIGLYWRDLSVVDAPVRGDTPWTDEIEPSPPTDWE